MRSRARSTEAEGVTLIWRAKPDFVESTFSSCTVDDSLEGTHLGFNGMNADAMVTEKSFFGTISSLDVAATIGRREEEWRREKRRSDAVELDQLNVPAYASFKEAVRINTVKKRTFALRGGQRATIMARSDTIDETCTLLDVGVS
jgi:hypothetical protein